MIYLNVFALNCLLTFEFFVLICAIFLWAYTSRHSLNKWLRYSAIAIAGIVKLIIICTIVNAFMHHYCGRGNWRGMSHCGMMRGHHGGQMSCCHGGEKMKCPMMHGEEDMEEEEEEDAQEHEMKDTAR